MSKARLLAVLSALLGALVLSAPAMAEPPVVSIIGGTTSGNVPYAAAIRATVGATTYFCTGSLIAPRLVLTAAHCVYQESGALIPTADYSVKVGLADGSAPARLVSEVIRHPAWNPDTLQGDVAILRLSADAQAGTTAIPLATSADAALYAAGQPAVVMGWGITSNATNAPPSTILQMGVVAVQANSTCSAASAGISFRPTYDLCAAAPAFTPAACHGDSGGPLVANSASGTPVQIGIVSYGVSGTCAQGPDFYTRASSIQAWAASVVAGAPITTPFVPPFAAPAVALALNADGVVATFTAVPDPATLPTGFIATLYSAGGALATQPLAPGSTTAAFPGLPPGTYTVGVVADYTEGASTAGASAAVALAPPANTVRPSVKGTGIVGSTLTCLPGTWAWPGAATLTAEWMRNGAATRITGRSYRVRAADAGKQLACQVLLRIPSGYTATAQSAGLRSTAKLAVTTRPRLTGSHAVGARLVCAAGSWKHTGTLKLSYAWLRDGKALAGAAARKAKRTIKAGDAGHRLACRVKATTGKQSASATSPAVKATAKAKAKA